MSWRDIIKEDIKKYSEITWRDIEIWSVDYKNRPDDFKGDNIYFTESGATVKGVFDPDVRDWGIKSVNSYATAVSFTAEIVDEEDEDDVIGVLEIEIQWNDIRSSYSSEAAINPSNVTIEVDMKGQKDPKNFDVSCEIEWEGSW